MRSFLAKIAATLAAIVFAAALSAGAFAASEFEAGAMRGAAACPIRIPRFPPRA